MDLWNSFEKTLVEGRFVYKYPDGRELVMPDEMKVVAGSMAALESGWGRNGLVTKASHGYPTYNFFSLKYPKELPRVPFRIEKVKYNGGDGEYEYCDFYSIHDAISAFWAWFFRSPYAGAEKFFYNGRRFLDEAGPHFCPPGYTLTAFWRRAHGTKNYTTVVWDELRPIVLRELIALGLPQDLPLEPVIVPTSPTHNLSIMSGVLMGEGVQHFFVNNYDPWDRKETVGLVVHTPGARSTGKEAIGQGIFNEWNRKGSGKSAQVLIDEIGRFVQAVDLDKIAYHCYGWNPRTIGVELANIGPFYPWQEVFGRFYRFRWQLWEQSIAKAELILATTAYGEKLYYLPPTEAQILSLIEFYDLVQTRYGRMWIKGHDELNAKADPGPRSIFPWDRLR